MGKIVLEKIQVTPLRRINTPGGDVLKVLMRDEDSYESFGEAYFSEVNAGAIKAWKLHKRMTLNLVVPVGMVRFVFCEETGETPDFRAIEIGAANYARITVRPGIWFGFKGIAPGTSLVLNIADIMHDPEEVERRAVEEINYNW
jgi:dTDP-4-dehydrorhamnose 3,5-epimerase